MTIIYLENSMPLSKNAFNTLEVALGSDSVANEIASAINNGNDSAINSVTDAQRVNINSTKQGLMVYDLDNDSLYSLQGNTITNATYFDSQLTFTINQAGPIGNNYIVFYDEILQNNTIPCSVSLDNSQTPNGNYTIHILASQNFDNTVAQILQAFAGGVLSFVLTVAQTSGSPSDLANYGSGNLAGGTPSWGIVNQSAILAATVPGINAAINANNAQLENVFSTQFLNVSKNLSVNGASPSDTQSGKVIANIGSTIFHEMIVTSPSTNALMYIPDILSTWFGGNGGSMTSSVVHIDLTVTACLADGIVILGGTQTTPMVVWKRTVALSMSKNMQIDGRPQVANINVQDVYDYNDTGTGGVASGPTLGSPVITSVAHNTIGGTFDLTITVANAAASPYKFRVFMEVHPINSSFLN